MKIYKKDKKGDGVIMIILELVQRQSIQLHLYLLYQGKYYICIYETVFILVIVVI